MKEVELFSDGACSGNPGPGGWGSILRFKGIEKELSGGEDYITTVWGRGYILQDMSAE